jgi:hypothetical protein
MTSQVKSVIYTLKLRAVEAKTVKQSRPVGSLTNMALQPRSVSGSKRTELGTSNWDRETKIQLKTYLERREPHSKSSLLKIVQTDQNCALSKILQNVTMLQNMTMP